MITVLVISFWTVAAVAVCWSNHRGRLAATPAPPPPGDPDATADDYDDDHVERITKLPPVPASVWDDFDEVMFRWFAEGAR